MEVGIKQGKQWRPISLGKQYYRKNEELMSKQEQT